MWPMIEASQLVTLGQPLPPPPGNPPETCVFFDVGSVLLDLNWDACWDGLSRVHGSPTAFSLRHFLDQSREFTAAWCTGFLGPAAYARAFAQTFCEAGGPALDVLQVKEITDAIVGEARPRVLRLARGLKEQGFLLGILSNATPWHEVLIETSLHLRNLFDVIVYSQDVGFEKPDPRIYRAAEALARRHSPGVRHFCFVDDLPANVQGARACGWDASLVCLVEDKLVAAREAGSLTDAAFAHMSQQRAHLVWGDAGAQRVEALFSRWLPNNPA